MLIVGYKAVAELLAGREREIIGLVRDAYRLHDEGRTAVPHSVFLRFPDNTRDRIIGLPAYLGGAAPVAGMKWISSFPGNLDAGLARASAAIVLNSLATGHPEAVIEGSLISAKRTAASAALAAALLTEGREPDGVALIGCGVINYEVLRFLAAALPGVRSVSLYDSDPARAAGFAARAGDLVPGASIAVAGSAAAALAAHRLVSIATTAAEPHLPLEPCPPGTVVLHLSLRDLFPADILASVNVVDDADHVCRERTSPHLTEQLTGDRRFIAASIGALCLGAAELPGTPNDTVVFSPFGLGVLDVALAGYVRSEAVRRGLGVPVDDFLP